MHHLLCCTLPSPSRGTCPPSMTCPYLQCQGHVEDLHSLPPYLPETRVCIQTSIYQ
ncbi:hypothetical protein BDW67DRAFT_51032 [Aspergillus spinulosporus]